MERVTFPDEQVRGVLEGLVAVKLDVDLEETRAARERFTEGGGVPQLVLADASGAVLWRARGSRPAAQLAAELTTALEAGPSAEDPEAALLRECVRLVAEGRHAQAIDVADRYLAAHDAHAEDVRLLRARARFARDGVREEWLEPRIKELIPILGEPWPGDTLGGRLKRLFGGDVEEGAGERWVKRQNETAQALVGIGEPAVALLLEATREGSPEVAKDCGVILGRIRSPGARDTLLAMARERGLPAKTRLAVANAMGGYKDPAFLEALAAWVRDPAQPARVRYEAASGIRDTLWARDDVDALRWASWILETVAESGVPVRGQLLQGLMRLRAPYDLSKLAPLLRDGRVAYLDVRVADLACWCLLRATGQGLEGGDETTDAARFVADWYERTKGDLRWDAERRHYVVGSR
jgi:hypothetical protein